MKVKVIKPFADKETFKMYTVGQVIDLPSDRASSAVSRGLVAEIAVKVPKNVETADKAPEKKTANEKKPHSTKNTVKKKEA